MKYTTITVNIIFLSNLIFTSSCCKQHNDCYEMVHNKYNLTDYFFQMYWVTYNYECDIETKEIVCPEPQGKIMFERNLNVKFCVKNN